MTAFGGALNDPTKVMGSRIGAYIVDLVVVLVVTFGTMALLGLSDYHKVDAGTPLLARELCRDVTNDFGTGPRMLPQESGDRVSRCFNIGSSAWVASEAEAQSTESKLTLVTVVVSALDWVVLTAITGASIGKLLFGLRVVSATGQRAGIGRNTVRWLVLVVDTACCWLPGLLSAFNSKGHRRIGDMAAGTYVVHRSAMGRLLNIPGHLVVRKHDAFGGWGPAPAEPELTLAEGGGIDKPVFDPSRNAYVRYDQASGVWFQWDDATQAWIPAQQ